MFSKSTVSSFGNLISIENSDKLRDVFLRYQVLFYAFGTWLYTVAYIMINPFIKLYTSGVNDTAYSDSLLAVLFTIIGILNMIRVPNNTMIEASGHYKQTQNRAFTEAVINISISLIFVQIVGIYGVLIGSLCSYIYRSLDIIIYSSKHILGINSKITFILLSPNLLISTLVVLSISNFVNLQVATWYDWIKYASIISVVTGCIILILNNIIHKGFIKNTAYSLKSLIS